MSTRSKAAPRFGLDGRSTCLKHVLEQVLEADSTSPLYKSVLEHFGNDEDKFNVVDYFLCNQTFFENLTYTERILENPSEMDPAKHIYKTEIHDVPNYLRANCIFFKRFLEDKKNEGADVNTEKFYLGITFDDFMDWKAEEMTMKTASPRVAKSRDIVMDFNKVDANPLPSPPPVEPLKTEDAVDSTPSSPGSRKLLAIPTCVPPSKEAVYAILPNDDDDSNAKENIEFTASHSSLESVDDAAPSKVFNMDPQLSLFHGGYRVVPTVKLKMIPSDIIAELHLQATDLRASAGGTTCAFSDGLDPGPSYNAFTMMSGSIATMVIQGFGNHGSDDASYPCMGSATLRGANIQGHYYDLRGVFFTVCSILCDPSWHYLTPILAQDLGEDVQSDAKHRVKTCQVFCNCVASSTILFYAHANSKTHASPFQLLDIDEHSRETTLATWCILCLKRIHGVLLSSNECEWFRTDPRNSDVASPSFQSEPRTTSIASGLTSTLNSSTVDIESRLPTRLHAVATGASLSSPFYFHYVLTSAPSPNKLLINLSGINMGRTTTDTMGQYDDPTMSIGSVPATESGAVTILGRRANTGDAIVSLCSLFCAPSGHTTPSLAPQDHGETSTEQQSPAPIVSDAMFEFGENVTIVRDEEASVCARGISRSDVLNSGAEMSIAETNTAGTIGDFGDNEIPNDFFDDWSHNVDDLESDDGSNEEIALELAFDGTVNGSVLSKPQEEKSYENAIEIEEQAQVPVKLPIKGATIALITMDPCIDRTDDNDVEGSKDGREIQDDEVLILDRLELLMGTVELPNETVNRVERQECAMTLIDVKEYDMMDKDKILQNDGYDEDISEDISRLFPDLAEFILDLQSEFERSIAAVLDDDDLIASPGSASPVRSELIALNDLPSPSGAEKLPSPTAQVQLDCFPKIFDVDDDCTIVSPLDMNSFIDEFSRKNTMNLESLMGSIVIGEHFYSNSLRLKAPSDSDATVLPFDRGPSKLLTASNGSLRSLPFDRGPCLPPTALRVVPRLIDARRNKLLSRILLLVRNSLLRGLLSTRLLIFERLFVVSAFLFKKRVASSETTSPFYLFKETHGRIF